MEAAEVGDDEADPPKERLRAGVLGLGNQQEPGDGEGSTDVDAEDGIDTASTGVPTVIWG